MVGVAGEEDDQKVIRRAARIAARTPGSDLLAVHVVSDDGLAVGHSAALEAQRALVTSLGGSFSQLPGADVAEALLSFARAENATQMVLGASRRCRLVTLIAGKSIPTTLACRAEHIDVHLVSRGGTADHGHKLARVLTALSSRRALAARDSAEAAALTRLAGCVLRGRGDPPALLEEMRQMFGLAAVSLLEFRQNGSGPSCYVVASAGEQPPGGPGADVELPVSDTFTLAARGQVPSQEDLRVLLSCAVEVVAGISYRRQEERQAQAARHEADLRSRAALLAATGQNAREQLAAASAALTALAASEGHGPAGRAAVLADALQRSPAGPPPVVTAASRNSRVEVCITDQGPDQHDDGASLAFRLARDLTDAMGDTMRSEPIPGGGRSVVLTLPAAAPRPEAAGTLVPGPDDTQTCPRPPSAAQT